MATSNKTAEKPVKAKPAVAAKAAAKTVSKPAAKPAAKTTAKVAKPAAKPVAAKATKAVAAATPAAKAKPAAPKKTAASGAALSPEQRRFYVEVAAYYIAERRGFHGGSEVADWAAAESEIDRLLKEGVLKP